MNKKKERPRSDVHRRIFAGAIFVACLIVVPFARYSMQINDYAQLNKPEGF